MSLEFGITGYKVLNLTELKKIYYTKISRKLYIVSCVIIL